jgi:hypothetical protein
VSAPKKKPQKPAPLRIMRKDFPTSRPRTAELKATAADRWFVDYDGPKGPDGLIIGSQMMHGIRDRKNSDQFDARPGMTDSQLRDEVARLNTGAAVSPVSQGKGRKPRYATEAARWVEVLWNVPETRARLRAAIDSGAKLSPEDVRELMAFRCVEGLPSFDEKGFPVGHYPGFPLPTITERNRQRAAKTRPGSEENKKRRAVAEADERKLLNAVSRQLERVLGIKRTDGGQRNEHRDKKRGAAL